MNIQEEITKAKIWINKGQNFPFFGYLLFQLKTIEDKNIPTIGTNGEALYFNPDFLKRFNVPCYKVASACLTDRELLTNIRETGKPVILSTGMSSSSEIRKAVKLLGQDKLILLSCVSTYPTTKLEEQNLDVINTLKNIYDCPIGYSGHEPDTFPTLIAMALGANMVERHITLGRTMYGSDQASSLERKGLEMICQRARELPKILGNGEKNITESEKPIMKKLRRVDTI